MDRIRAETYLRQVAEAELRRAISQPAQSSPAERHPGAGGTGTDSVRLDRVAQALIAVGAVDASVAEAVNGDFGIALAVRSPNQSPAGARRAATLRRQAIPRTLRTSAYVMASSPGPPPGPPGGPVPDRIALAGTMLPVVSADDEYGELHLLAYSHTRSGARLTAIAWSRGHAPYTGSPGLEPLSATDDKGNSYGFFFDGVVSGGSAWIGELTLRPEPPPDIRWLEVESGGTVCRIDLDTGPAAADVTLTRDAHTPGEHYLHGIAAQILASHSVSLHDLSRPVIEFRPVLPWQVTHGIGDIVAALQAADALSPLSPVPGQLATLCESLDITEHRIAAPPARDLPAPWLSMLSHIHRRKPRAVPAAEGCAGAAVALPELDGVRLLVLGLHNGMEGTALQVRAISADSGSRAVSVPLIWIRDESGRWHTARVNGPARQHDGELSARLDVVPPLGRDSTIELLAVGQSAQVHATLPLRWS